MMEANEIVGRGNNNNQTNHYHNGRMTDSGWSIIWSDVNVMTIISSITFYPVVQH